MRPVISYDDITEPTTNATNDRAAETNGRAQVQTTQLGPQLPSTNQPPTKRRRTNQSRPQHKNRQPPNKSQRQWPVQHWDEPGGSNMSMTYGGDEEAASDEDAVGEEEEGGEEEEESRELTHDEIWDDSALIDAWNSASAEYEAYHGKGDKSWQNAPTKKSPLWFNIPPDHSKKAKGKDVPKQSFVPSTNGVVMPEVPSTTQDEADSRPLDFDTYVPSHDPSLAPQHPPGVPGPDYTQYYMPPLQGPMVGQDEAFQRALSAMYWGGYWTAVYHYNRRTQNEGPQGAVAAESDDDDEEMGKIVDEEDFVATQR